MVEAGNSGAEQRKWLLSCHVVVWLLRGRGDLRDPSAMMSLVVEAQLLNCRWQEIDQARLATLIGYRPPA